MGRAGQNHSGGPNYKRCALKEKRHGHEWDQIEGRASDRVKERLRVFIMVRSSDMKPAGCEGWKLRSGEKRESRSVVGNMELRDQK